MRQKRSIEEIRKATKYDELFITQIKNLIDIEDIIIKTGLEKNIVLNKSFGKEVIKSYITLKNRELKNYKDQEGSIKNDLITEWEKINTLDC